uniref:Uncharacterized protein n=2 Tax=Acinetobacter TaxID=469 RepID=A0A0C5GWF8_ACILW|nr:hypothetical protein [Acinetobacter lwoffii]AJP18100.1 hypothetical protein [Acinetobacter sp. JN247]
MELFYKELGILKKIIFKRTKQKKPVLYWLFYFSKRLFLV